MREAAIAAVIARLNTITVANSYTLNVGKVSRLVNRDSLSARQFPAIMVVDDADEQREPKAGGYADVYFTLNLVGFVSSRDNSSRDMNALDVAMKKAISTSRTLGGIVANVTILPRVETNLDGGEIETTFTRPIQIYYVANEANGD